MLAVLALTTMAGLAVIVVPYIWDAAPGACEAGSKRLACSGLGGVLLWDVPLLGIPAIWLVGLVGIGLHRGRRPVWVMVSLLGLVILYLADYWIAVA
ncbi:hypothetical protein GCM10010442_50030 [Kitasatospora kifunensis]